MVSKLFNRTQYVAFNDWRPTSNPENFKCGPREGEKKPSLVAHRVPYWVHSLSTAVYIKLYDIPDFILFADDTTIRMSVWHRKITLTMLTVFPKLYQEILMSWINLNTTGLCHTLNYIHFIVLSYFIVLISAVQSKNAVCAFIKHSRYCH